MLYEKFMKEDQIEAITTKTANRAAQILGLKNAQLAKILGLSVPTVARMRKGGRMLVQGSKSYELALYLIKLFQNLETRFGNNEWVIQSWMMTPNSVLSGRPVDLIQSVDGLIRATEHANYQQARA